MHIQTEIPQEEFDIQTKSTTQKVYTITTSFMPQSKVLVTTNNQQLMPINLHQHKIVSWEHYKTWLINNFDVEYLEHLKTYELNLQKILIKQHHINSRGLKMRHMIELKDTILAWFYLFCSGTWTISKTEYMLIRIIRSWWFGRKIK